MQKYDLNASISSLPCCAAVELSSFWASDYDEHVDAEEVLMFKLVCVITSGGDHCLLP